MTISANRYERKFLISLLRTRDLEHMVKLHPALFSQAYPPRQVNNIYLDSHDLKNYWDNVCGSANRLKARIRWYGNLFGPVAKPVLELKIKSALTGRKESYAIQPFTIEQGFTFNTLTEAFDRSNLPEGLREQLRAMQPTLLNRYHRRYYLSADKLFRLTIDSDMAYTQIARTENRFVHSVRDHIRTILELKYDMASDDQADSVSGLFPFRITRSSKYVSGIDWVNKGYC